MQYFAPDRCDFLPLVYVISTGTMSRILRLYLGEAQSELVLFQLDFLQADLASIPEFLFSFHLLRRQDNVAGGVKGLKGVNHHTVGQAPRLKQKGAAHTESNDFSMSKH